MQSNQVRQNYIVDFDIKHLKQITQEHKYVVAAFIDNTTFDFETVENAFTELSIEYLGQIDIIFLLINVQQIDHDNFEQYDITQKNEIHLFINQFQKKFQDMIQTPIIKFWLEEVLQSNVQIINNEDQSIKDNNFNYIYVKTKITQNNSQQIKLLSEMVSPLKVYTGMNEENENKNLPEGSLFVYRKYRNMFIKIEFGLNTQQIAQDIEDKKFPDYLEPNQDSYDLIINQKIPALIYYCQDMNDEIIQILKLVSKQYREYLVLMIVNPENHNSYTLFFMDIMGVKYGRQLRILNNHQDFKRYKFIGQLEANLIDFFIENYLHSNIRSYSISENIIERYDDNLRNFNAQDMKQLNKQKMYIIYTYGGPTYDDKDEEIFQSHLDFMHEQANENQKNFKIVFGILNRNQNDLREVKIEDVPLFLICQNGKILNKIQPDKFNKIKVQEIIKEFISKDEL